MGQKIANGRTRQIRSRRIGGQAVSEPMISRQLRDEDTQNTQTCRIGCEVFTNGDTVQYIHTNNHL